MAEPRSTQIDRALDTIDRASFGPSFTSLNVRNVLMNTGGPTLSDRTIKAELRANPRVKMWRRGTGHNPTRYRLEGL